MSNPFDDFGFHAKDGARFGVRWIIIPFVIIIFGTLALAGGLYASKVGDIPTGPPDLTDPKVAGQTASTDLYGNALLSAFNCIRDYSKTSCDQEEKKSKLIIAATQEIIVINGKQIPIPDKPALEKALTTDPYLSKLEFTNFTTQEKGSKETTITYTNPSEQKLIMTFEKNDKNELVLKSMEATL